MTETGEYKEGRAEYFRAYYAKHREELNQHHKEWKRAHRIPKAAHVQTEEELAQRKERQRVASQKYYESHKEQRRACGQKYREAHKDALREVGKQRLQARRKFVEQQKVGKVCNKCHKEADPRKLVFHHVDPATKLFGLADCDHPEEMLLAEIAKCDVLCNSCHQKLHKNL